MLNTFVVFNLFHSPFCYISGMPYCFEFFIVGVCEYIALTIYIFLTYFCEVILYIIEALSAKYNSFYHAS